MRLLAWLADAVCHLFPIQHITYSLRPLTEALASVEGCGALIQIRLGRFGIWPGAWFFAAAQALKSGAHKMDSARLYRTHYWGAGLLISYGLGTRDYLGLGVWSADPEVVTICSAFHQGCGYLQLVVEGRAYRSSHSVLALRVGK